MRSIKIKESFLYLSKSNLLQELFYSGIGCILFIIIYSFFPNHYWNKPYRITVILILTLLFFAFFILLNQTESRTKFFKLDYKRNIILFSILNFAGYLFLFYNANWGYNGLAGDNFYRTAYITQMAHSGYPQDFAYKGLSGYYAPFYWYFLALISIIFQIPPYKMIRIGFLIICYILPIILFEFWKKIYEAKLAFFITIISSIYLVNIYSPDHMIAAFLIIPYIIYYLENITNKKFKKKDYVLGGIIGSITFCTFFFYFLMIPIYYFIIYIQNRDEFKKKFKHLLYSFSYLSIFSIWFWGPLLTDIVLIGFESHQNRYFQPDMLTYPLLDYIGLNVWSIFNIIGLIYILRNYKTQRDMKVFGNLLIAIHIIFFFGLIGILNHFPIMHIRIEIISRYILMISSCIFYFKFFYFLVRHDMLKKNINNNNLYQIEIILLLILMTLQMTSYWTYISESEAYRAAYRGNSMHEVREIFEELDYEDKIFLTNEWRIAMFLPIYVFLLPNPYYSHPSALYNKRVEFLVELSECDTSKEFYKMIINNRFGPIDYFYLDLEENGTVLVFDLAIEKFPGGREYYEVEFERALFNNTEYFEEIIIKGELIYRTKY